MLQTTNKPSRNKMQLLTFAVSLKRVSRLLAYLIRICVVNHCAYCWASPHSSAVSAAMPVPHTLFPFRIFRRGTCRGSGNETRHVHVHVNQATNLVCRKAIFQSLPSRKPWECSCSHVLHTNLGSQSFICNSECQRGWHTKFASPYALRSQL